MTGERNPLVRADAGRWPETGPAWRQRLLRLHDTGARALARAHLPGTLALLDRLGRAAHVAGLQGPSSAEVGALFGWLPRRELGRIARDIAALRLKNRAAIALVLGGRTGELARLVRWADEAGRRALVEKRSATVAVACHIGAFFGVRAALQGLDRPPLRLSDLAGPDAGSRAAALTRAVERLRAGDMVVATLDGPGGTSTREVICLGRRVSFRRGPFTLARLTGAAIVPVVCAWTPQYRIEVRVGAPIPSPARDDLDAAGFEGEMAAQTAQWFEACLRSEPQLMWHDTLRYYLAAPRAVGIGEW